MKPTPKPRPAKPRAIDADQFIKNLSVALAFHRNNTNDPHGIGNSVIAALEEVKYAASNAAPGLGGGR